MWSIRMHQNVYFKQLRSVLCPSMSPFIYSSLILLSIDIMPIIHGSVGTVIHGAQSDVGNREG